MRRPLLYLLIALALVPLTVFADHHEKVFTVYLVRHAEKAAEPREDPPLTDAGRARSEQLARTLGPAGVKAVYTSQFLRTRATGDTVARTLGITATVVPIKMSAENPNAISPVSYDTLVAKLVERGENALVVGHSNTLAEIIKRLGGGTIPNIDEKAFDDLFVVTVYGKGLAKVTHLKYGA
jgi:phosphohistidine phosphatase SixA